MTALDRRPNAGSLDKQRSLRRELKANPVRLTQTGNQLRKLPINRLENGLDDGPAPAWFHKWGFATLALAAYRAGKAEEAIQWIRRCQEAQEYDKTPALQALGLSLLAMAQHQLGHAQEGRQALAQATALIDQYLPKLAGGELGAEHNWLIAQILRREAAELTAGPTEDPTPEAKATPNPKTE